MKLSPFKDLEVMYKYVIEDLEKGEKVIISGRHYNPNHRSRYQFGQFILKLIQDNQDKISKEAFEDYYIQANEMMK